MEEKLREKYDELIMENSENLKPILPKQIKSTKKHYSKKMSLKTTQKIAILVAIVIAIILLKNVMDAGNTNILGSNNDNIFKWIGILCIIMPVLVVFCVIIISKYSKYFKLFKEKVVMPLIKELDCVEEADLNKKIPQQIYEQANFRNSDFDGYGGRYYIKGCIDNVKVEMSKVTTTITHTYEDSNNRTQTETRTTFSGFLIAATLKDIITDGYIHIFNDKDDSSVLKFKLPETKVHMDSMQFEQEFDVYSTDSIKALEILTSDIMQRLIDEKQQINSKYDISITQNMIIMRIFGKTDMFEMRPKEKTTNATYAEDLKDNIIQDVKFVEHMFNFMRDLSNDIYSKK